MATRIPKLSSEYTIPCCRHNHDKFLCFNNTDESTASDMSQKGHYEEDSEPDSENSTTEKQVNYAELDSDMQIANLSRPSGHFDLYLKGPRPWI